MNRGGALEEQRQRDRPSTRRGLTTSSPIRTEPLPVSSESSNFTRKISSGSGLRDMRLTPFLLSGSFECWRLNPWKASEGLVRLKWAHCGHSAGFLGLNKGSQNSHPCRPEMHPRVSPRGWGVVGDTTRTTHTAPLLSPLISGLSLGPQTLLLLSLPMKEMGPECQPLQRRPLGLYVYLESPRMSSGLWTRARWDIWVEG